MGVTKCLVASLFFRVLQSDPEVFAGPLGTLVERLPETHIEARC